MDRTQVIDYVRTTYGTEPEYLWKKYPNYAVLRHLDNQKWYAVIMDIPKKRLGLEGDAVIDIIDLKAEPLLIGSLRAKDGFHPACHMNKDKWISIRLDGSIPEDEIKNLIDFSYELTETKHNKRRNRCGNEEEK